MEKWRSSSALEKLRRSYMAQNPSRSSEELIQYFEQNYCHPFRQELKNHGVIMPRNVLKIKEITQDEPDIDQLLRDAGIKNSDLQKNNNAIPAQLKS
jgi:hypothetical protein